jgi:hypothetical protein
MCDTGAQNLAIRADVNPREARDYRIRAVSDVRDGNDFRADAEGATARVERRRALGDILDEPSGLEDGRATTGPTSRRRGDGPRFHMMGDEAGLPVSMRRPAP